MYLPGKKGCGNLFGDTGSILCLWHICKVFIWIEWREKYFWRHVNYFLGILWPDDGRAMYGWLSVGVSPCAAQAAHTGARRSVGQQKQHRSQQHQQQCCGVGLVWCQCAAARVWGDTTTGHRAWHPAPSEVTSATSPTYRSTQFCMQQEEKWFQFT